MSSYDDASGWLHEEYLAEKKRPHCVACDDAIWDDEAIYIEEDDAWYCNHRVCQHDAYLRMKEFFMRRVE